MAETIERLAITPEACRMARAGLKLHRSQLAARAGIHPATIKLIEDGEVQPQQRTIDRLLRAFTKAGVMFGDDGSVRVL